MSVVLSVSTSCCSNNNDRMGKCYEIRALPKEVQTYCHRRRVQKVEYEMYSNERQISLIIFRSVQTLAIYYGGKKKLKESSLLPFLSACFSPFYYLADSQAERDGKFRSIIGFVPSQ